MFEKKNRLLNFIIAYISYFFYVLKNYMTILGQGEKTYDFVRTITFEVSAC